MMAQDINDGIESELKFEQTYSLQVGSVYPKKPSNKVVGTDIVT